MYPNCYFEWAKRCVIMIDIKMVVSRYIFLYLAVILICRYYSWTKEKVIEERTYHDSSKQTMQTHTFLKKDVQKQSESRYDTMH